MKINLRTNSKKNITYTNFIKHNGPSLPHIVYCGEVIG